MALKHLNKSTTNLTTAADWDSVTNTPTIGTTTLTNFGIYPGGTPKYTATFTAPNTTNACTGVWIKLVAGQVAGATTTAVLQENSVNTVCMQTISTTYSAEYWTYFRFPTPYVFTSTSAGYYRFALYSSSGSVDGLSDSGGSLLCFIATDDRTGAPGATDDLLIAGDVSSPVTLTLSGTNGWGSGTDTTWVYQARNVKGATLVGMYGKILEDYTTTNTTTIKGISAVSYLGEWDRGTVAHPIDAGQVSTLNFDMDVTETGGLLVQGTGKFICQGAPMAYWKTDYEGGVGTAVDPVITNDTTGWAVNDELVFPPTQDTAITRDEVERKFIRTISTTSITLSDTVGGAEAGLTYTHTGCEVINLTRNVVFGTTSTSLWSFIYCFHQLVEGNVDFDWTEFKYFGASNYQFTILNYVNVDNCSSVDSIKHPFYFTSSYPVTYSNLVAVFKNPQVSTASGIYIGTKGCTFNDIYSIRAFYLSFYFSSAYGNTLNRLKSISTGMTTNSSRAFYVYSSAKNTFNDCEIHCCRGTTTSSIYSSICLNTANDNIFNDCLFGTKGKNQVVVSPTTAQLITAIFNNCNFGSYNTLIVNNYIGMVDGSYVNFAPLTFGGADDYSYRPTGIIQKSGTGLTDTTCRTAGGYAVHYVPTVTDDYLYWEFNIPTGNIQNKTMMVGVWCKINNAAYYAGTYQLPRLTLIYDGNSVAYAQASETTDWQFLPISFSPLTTTGQITVKLSTLTDATGSDSYVYWDDFKTLYPAEAPVNTQTLDLWVEGMPVTPPIATVLSAKDVWAASDTDDYGSGTMGNRVKKLKNPSLLIDGEIIA